MAALVFCLALLAASPAAHEWLHGEGVSGGDHQCAVVLFAAGVSLPLAQVPVVPPSAEWRPGHERAAAEIFLLPPRYLRQPERGPPASG